MKMVGRINGEKKKFELMLQIVKIKKYVNKKIKEIKFKEETNG